MKQQYLKTITEACIASNPSILDLVFGCKIRDMESERELIFLGLDDDQRIRASYPIDQYSTTWVEDEYCQILGREIQLHDVLLALGSLNKGNKVNDFHKLEYSIGVDSFWIGNSISHNSCDWNLLKPFHEQDEDVLKFISELLEKK